MATELVSVVLPVYNQATYLPDALDSILGQAYESIDLIVVNDGSTDATPDVIEEYRRRHQFKVIHQRNHGLPKALNAGFALAQGGYLTWTSADNVAKPHMLTVLAATLDAHPDVGLVYADWEVIDEVGQVIARVTSVDHDRRALLMHNYINACFLYRRECMDRIGGYDHGLRGGEDWDYWLRISRHYQMLRVAESLYLYREHAESLTSRSQQLVQERQLVGYRQFASVWQKREPLSWWCAKLWWNWRKRVLRRPIQVVRESFPARGTWMPRH